MESKARPDDDETQAFLDEEKNEEPRSVEERQTSSQNCRKLLRLLRWSLEISLFVITVLLWTAKPSPPGATLRSTPVPRFPRKMYTFKENPRYLRGDMWFNETDTLHTLHNWIELSAKARGYVSVPDHASYDLPKPFTVALGPGQDGPGYMMTVFHQLHCLSYLAEHYQQGYGGVGLTEEVAHHTSHCFNYLRQGIMCSADTTLEGRTKEGPGEGSEHECVDYDALLAWANEHSAIGWRGNLPDTAVL